MPKKTVCHGCGRPEMTGWRLIDTAPLDAWVLVYAASRDGLDGFICTARYHSDGGWCVDELREVTHWMPLPEPPR